MRNLYDLIKQPVAYGCGLAYWLKKFAKWILIRGVCEIASRVDVSTYLLDTVSYITRFNWLKLFLHFNKSSGQVELMDSQVEPVRALICKGLPLGRQDLVVQNIGWAAVARSITYKLNYEEHWIGQPLWRFDCPNKHLSIWTICRLPFCICHHVFTILRAANNAEYALR